MDVNVGYIQLFAFRYFPQNWYMCSGSEVRITDFQNLFSVIRNKFGGDGISYFKFPDLTKAKIHQNIGYCINLTGQPPEYNEGYYFLGQIQLLPYNNVPNGWKLCNGELLTIKDYQALYALLANRFGGDGKVTFAIPNLTDTSPIDGMAYYIAIQGIWPPRD